MIVAGFGGNTRATVNSYRSALQQTWVLGQHIDALAVPESKLEALRPLAMALDLPLIGISRDGIAGTLTPTQSEYALESWDTGSVAEACALIAGGPAAQLITARSISSDRLATCALARKGTP